MAEHTHQSIVPDHSVGNLIIFSLVALCGLTFIFLVAVF